MVGNNQTRAADDSGAAAVAETSRAAVENKASLSFSISRILSEPTDDKKASCQNELSRVPSTVHHFGSITGENGFIHLEHQLKPRACSTPDTSEYPSPTPSIHNMPFNPHVFRSRSDSIPFAQDPGRLKPNLEVSDTIPLRSSFKCFDNASDKSLDSMGESYLSSPSPLKMKKKKTRTVFSRSQVYQLESAFDLKRYLSSAERAGLAAQLNLSETQIKIWFQNRRNKWKRQINGEMDEIPIPPGFASGLLPPSFNQPSYNSIGHVMSAREELLRGSMAAPAYYTHPYPHEVRLRSSYIT